MVSPEGLLTNSDAAEVAVVFTPKEGERGSLWHVGGVEMLKSVCNQFGTRRAVGDGVSQPLLRVKKPSLATKTRLYVAGCWGFPFQER